MKKQKRIVIAGGAGFIGSHLCEHFLNGGHKVVVIDNLLTGSQKNIQPFLKNKNFLWMRKDITRHFRLSGRVEAVLNFASPASPPDYLKYPLQTLEVGSLGTQQLLGLARQKKAVFLQASTSEVYGDPEVSPQVESYWGKVNPVGPRSVYDEAKRFSEALTMAYHRQYRVDTRIIRIFNTYGQRMRLEDGRVIPNFISQALKGKPLTVYGRGDQTRSYCYVDDLVRGIEGVLSSSYHLPINLGNPNEMSVLSLGKLILEKTGSKSKIVYRPLPTDDPKQRCPDITLAKKLLDWEPTVALEKGLERTIEYFREQLLKK